MTNNPWGDGSNNPWGGGNKPSNNNGGGRNNPKGTPPDFDKILAEASEKFKSMFSNGSGANWFVGIAAGAVIVAWLSTGIYRVKTGEQGVVLQFGKYVRTTTSGLNYHLPYPFQQAILVDMELNRNVNVGYNRVAQQNNLLLTLSNTSANNRTEDVRQMLTGDENIVNIDFDIRWKVSDASNYLFKVRDPEQTVKAVSESVMREVVGRNQIDSLTEQRDQIEEKVKYKIQRTLDEYQAGIHILQVAIKDALPPDQVIDDFKDVQAARADRERFVEEANAYANKILPTARGTAVEMREKATAYKQRVIAEAKGDASRFEKIYEQYLKAPEVTRKRIYLETVEKLLADKNKVIISGDANKSGILPYMRLEDLSKKAQ